jgi:hypothetical protein
VTRAVREDVDVAVADLLAVIEQLTGAPSDGPRVSVPLEQLARLVELAVGTQPEPFVVDGGLQAVHFGPHDFRPVWRHALPGQLEAVPRTVAVEDLLVGL